MSLSTNFDHRRVGILHHVRDAIGHLWVSRDWKDRSSFLTPGNTLIDGAVDAYVHLISAFFNTRVAEVTGDHSPHDIDPTQFTREQLRPDDPEFLDQVWGTLITKLERGDDFRDADNKAKHYAQTLAATHMQMANVRVAKNWMESAPEGVPIIGYRRTLTGKNCKHCTVAAERLYFISTLAPIHENCDCGIAPVFEGEDHGLFTTRTSFPPVAPDPTLGSRLVQDDH